ncbi:MAG: hypothetical protein ABSE18_03135 [Minisyncoccia bacterium]|jgi:hypothetical protein
MNKAFGIVEILLYAAIFAAVVVVSVGAFVSVMRVQTNQTAAAEVEAQSQFLLQKIQFYVQQSSLIEMPPDTSSTTLKLRVAASSSDPTYFTLSSGTVYLQQGSGALQPLTSPKVAVTNLSFTKRANPPSHDTLSVAFTMTYNPSNLLQAFSEAFQTSIARVSAATFDSPVVPSSTGVYGLGTQTNLWASLNNIIDFVSSSTNIGINNLTPAYEFDVASGGSTTARFGTAAGDTVVVGGGAGKITAGTYDPIYNIGGEKYATYGAGMTGQKEETTGVLRMQPAAGGTTAAGTWKAVIDFGDLEKGSDLWLFSQVTDFGEGWSNLSVLLTPSFDGAVWYEKDAANDRLTVYGVPGSSASSLASAPGSLEASYRLTAPRFDSQQWPNASDDATTPGLLVPAKP